jgi:hypothetical protein
VIVAIGAYLTMHRKTAFCVKCGVPAAFGYSHRAESDNKDIASVCLNCLKAKLAQDYEQFEKRALIVEPAANLPCYVFQPSSKWKDCKLTEEAREMLSKMRDSCSHCGAKATFLWLTSKGLRLERLDELFAEGVSKTLFRWGNNPPQPVCGRCCVDLICSSIEKNGLTFLEVCGPRSEDGFVLAMGY